VLPVGSPDTLSPTEPAKPFCAPTVIVYAVALPTVTAWDEGVAEIEKSVAPVTLRDIVELWVIEPLVPVIVSGYEPTGLVEVVVILSVELPHASVADGVNDAVVPLGNPLTVSATVPPNPFRPPTPT
jgi:hypothetical protein